MPANAPRGDVGVMRRAVFVSLLMMVPLLGVRAWDPWPVQELRGRLFDWMQAIEPRRQDAAPVVIVDINEDSVASLGQWPWPRNVIARLIDTVADASPSVIGLDILFAEPDRMSPDQIARTLKDIPPEMRRRLEGIKSNDQILAESVSNAPVVLGIAVGAAGAKAGVRLPDDMTPVIEIGDDPRPFMPGYSGAVSNIEALTEASSGQGVVSFDLGSGGVARRFSGVARLDNQLIPSFALEMVRVASGRREVAVHAGLAGVEGFVSGDRFVPADQQGHVWPYFSLHRSQRFVSARDVLDGNFDRARLQGAYVLIGTTASALGDIFQVPVGTTMDGVEIQAQIIENILGGSMLVRPAYSATIELVIIFVSGLVIVLMHLLVRPWPGVAIFGILVFVLMAMSWLLFSRLGVLVDSLTPVLASFVVFATMMTARLIAEERARRERDARLRVLQDELSHVGRLSSLGQLSSAIAHEVNQPLAAIVNYLQAARRLQSDKADDPAVRKIEGMLEKASTQAERAAAIIRGLRSMVEQGEVETGEEDVKAMVEEAIALATIGVRGHRVTVRTHYARALPPVHVNRIQIQQVVVNLVRNAFDAMRDSRERVLLVQTFLSDDGHVDIAVSDTGPGIAQDMEDRLFQPFVSGKSDGMGIGLSICQSIVEAHGGRIWVDANSAQGVTIRFSIPVAKEGRGN